MVAFHTKPLGTRPAELRSGYANSAIAEPPLTLAAGEPWQWRTASHFGIEVPGTGMVDAEQARLGGTGLASADEQDRACCYARPGKLWVEGTPDGERWEIYTVLADSQAC